MKEQKRRQALNINDKRQKDESFAVYEKRQKKQEAETLYVWIDYPNIEKFSSYTGCMNALTTLKRLNLIQNVPDKKGNDYYVLTEFGCCCLLRKMCHNMIDVLPDSEDILTKTKNVISEINNDYRYWNNLRYEVDLLRKANLSPLKLP